MVSSLRLLGITLLTVTRGDETREDPENEIARGIHSMISQRPVSQHAVGRKHSERGNRFTPDEYASGLGTPDPAFMSLFGH